jgi:hypothetical protein
VTVDLLAGDQKSEVQTHPLVYLMRIVGVVIDTPSVLMSVTVKPEHYAICEPLSSVSHPFPQMCINIIM